MVRSGFVEGRHRGSVVVLDAAGAVVASAGDVPAPIFPRSSNKPMQAVGMLRAGLTRPTRPTWRWSRPATPASRSTVRGYARCCDAGGLTEADLGCPPDLPLAEDARDAVLRAGGRPAAAVHELLRQARRDAADLPAAGWPIEGYLDPAHPLQRRLRAAVEELAGEPAAAVGVDGCGAPVLAMSLTGAGPGVPAAGRGRDPGRRSGRSPTRCGPTRSWSPAPGGRHRG